MRNTLRALILLASLSGCGGPIAPGQADGNDCNYAAADTACGARSFCDPGEAVGNGGYTRSHTYGFLRDKTHVVGTCRPRGAAGASCQRAEACVSGRCARSAAAAASAGSAGTCE